MAFFVCYRHESETVVDAICTQLEKELGPDCVVGDWKWAKGVHNRQLLLNALDQSTALLVVIDSYWHQRRHHLYSEQDWIRREIRSALKMKLPVVPLLVDGSILPLPGELPPDILRFVACNGCRVELDSSRFHDGIRDLGHELRRLQDGHSWANNRLQVVLELTGNGRWQEAVSALRQSRVAAAYTAERSQSRPFRELCKLEADLLALTSASDDFEKWQFTAAEGDLAEVQAGSQRRGRARVITYIAGVARELASSGVRAGNALAARDIDALRMVAQHVTRALRDVPIGIAIPGREDVHRYIDEAQRLLTAHGEISRNIDALCEAAVTQPSAVPRYDFADWTHAATSDSERRHAEPPAGADTAEQEPDRGARLEALQIDHSGVQEVLDDQKPQVTTPHGLPFVEIADVPESAQHAREDLRLLDADRYAHKLAKSSLGDDPDHVTSGSESSIQLWPQIEASEALRSFWQLILDDFRKPQPESDTGAQLLELSALRRIEEHKREPFPSGRLDLLRFTVTAPCVVRRSVPFPLAVWGHAVGDLAEVVQHAVRNGARASLAEATMLPGSVSSLSLHARSMLGADQRRIMYWDDQAIRAVFIMQCSGEPGVRLVNIDVLLENLKIGRLRCAIEVGDIEGAMGLLPAEEWRARNAFASFAEQDSDAVLARLRRVSRLVPELAINRQCIEYRRDPAWSAMMPGRFRRYDSFYLFWSPAAQASAHVDKEWRCALEQGASVSGIMVGERVPPPAELESVPFYEWPPTSPIGMDAS